MRRMIFAFLLMFFALAIVVGCAKYELPSNPSPYVAITPLDADENGVIDGKDVQKIEAGVSTSYQSRVLPYFAKAGIKLETEEDIWTEENTNILKHKLTVAEWEQLIDGMQEWNKLRNQLVVTKAAAEGKPHVTDSGVVRNLAYQPNRLVPHLDDGRYILLTGIGVPTYASKYRRMADDLLYKLARNKKDRIEYDVIRTIKGDAYLQGYMHTNDCFVNAEMVARGYAKAVPSPPNSKYDSEFKRLEEEAKKAKRGIWALADDF